MARDSGTETPSGLIKIAIGRIELNHSSMGEEEGWHTLARDCTPGPRARCTDWALALFKTFGAEKIHQSASSKSAVVVSAIIVGWIYRHNVWT